MKTAVSIPNDVFAEAEKVARKLGISRSHLFSQAVREWLDARRNHDVTESYNRAFGDAGDVQDARLAVEAARRVLRDVEW